MSSPFQRFRPRDLGLDPRAVGLQDARQPSGGLAGTVAGVARGLSNAPTPTGVATSGDGADYYDAALSEDGDEEVTDLIDVVIPGPRRIGWLYVLLTGFATYPDPDYLVTYLANTYLGVVPIRGSARGCGFMVPVGGITAPATFRVATPSDEGTVSAALWVPHA